MKHKKIFNVEKHMETCEIMFYQKLVTHHLRFSINLKTWWTWFSTPYNIKKSVSRYYFYIFCTMFENKIMFIEIYFHDTVRGEKYIFQKSFFFVNIKIFISGKIMEIFLCL